MTDQVLTAVPVARPQRLSLTLSSYIARLFTLRFLAFLFGLVAIIMLVSTVDLLDRLASKDGVSISVILRLVLLKVPFLSQEVLPFTMLFTGLATFWALTRHQELVVTRSLGVSVWQFLMPAVLVSLAVGIVAVTAINPLSATLLAEYDRLEAKYERSEASLLSVSKGGLWLRQADENGQSVIHAERVSRNRIRLHRVIVFQFDGDTFLSRIDADRADLGEGEWVLRRAWLSKPRQPPQYYRTITVPTSLTRSKILESFQPPETISFWALPGFIDLLEQAGFTAQRHRLQFHKLLATPLLLVAMTLVAACFALRPQRRGRVGLVVLSGVLTGFGLYFLSNFVYALGFSAKIPVVLAAWTPATVTLLLGVAMLLHLEDG